MRLVVLLLLFWMALPGVVVAEQVTVTAVVPSPRLLGFGSWDTGRGLGLFRAPDILICLEVAGFRQCTDDPGPCEDEYICTVAFEAPLGDNYLVVLHDEDLMADDFIGQGWCAANSTCYLGWAVITVSVQ